MAVSSRITIFYNILDSSLFRTPVAEVEELSVSDEGQKHSASTTKPQRITAERRTASAAATVSSRDSSSSGGGQTITAESIEIDIGGANTMIPLIRASSHSPAGGAASTGPVAGAGHLAPPSTSGGGPKPSQPRPSVGPSRIIDQMVSTSYLWFWAVPHYANVCHFRSTHFSQCKFIQPVSSFIWEVSFVLDRSSYLAS